MCHLHPEETVDKFLVDLQHLALLVKEMPPEYWLKGAFVNGLPSHVKEIFRSSAEIPDSKSIAWKNLSHIGW